MSGTIRNVARAVVLHEGRILVCRAVGPEHYFFPGGGIEFGEQAMEALRREMHEEADAVPVRATFIGAAENVFTLDGVQAHEMITVFAVELADYVVVSKEAHIEFVWLSAERLLQDNILPAQLTVAVAQWMNDKKTFWVTNVE